jgi:predicted transcriptional regulator
MDLMTVEEVANELDITPQRVREYCRMGRLGNLWQNRWLITRKEFEAFKKTYTGKPGRPKKR